ncbi:helix-turn-helix transcriptional regulator [Agitococcus lubricus]|uniref:AlpA family transcriptional regulator n=1 Tax=Agitococcus lubricus TaxID=1077255 RepID=A0A2T5ITJ2_9GAMM|nr:AlpA family phage regulatory protein [Agitococcus lubricus]PTQ87184.1 AlpA family transcriptional regulator [Agitococcus lubricus]
MTKLTPNIIRAKQFRELTGIPDSTRADWEDPKSPRFDPTFPKKIKLGKRCAGYFYNDIIEWLAKRTVDVMSHGS